jgi:hypothetical protein
MKGKLMTKFQTFCKKHQTPILIASCAVATVAVVIAVNQVKTRMIANYTPDPLAEAAAFEDFTKAMALAKKYDAEDAAKLLGK